MALHLTHSCQKFPSVIVARLSHSYIYPGRPWPNLIPLPSSFTGSHKRKLSIDSSSDPSGKLKKTVQDDGSFHIQSTSSDKGPPTFTSSELLRGGDGERIQATFRGMHDQKYSRQLTICQTDLTKSIQIPVMKLPSYLPTELSAAVALLTQQKNAGKERRPGFLTLVLSSTPLGVYVSDEGPLSTHLPIVIRKDIRVLSDGRIEHHRKTDTTRLEPVQIRSGDLSSAALQAQTEEQNSI